MNYFSFRVVPLLMLALTVFGLVTKEVFAQIWPTRPVRIVVPFDAGGAADVPARIMAPEMSKALGQQVLIDNRPGAGSTIGTEVVAKSPADGYTVLLVSNPHAVNASLYKKLPYDPIEDFEPVLQFATSPNLLVVHPSLSARSVKELVALAKAKPGQIDYASSGNGSSQHLFTVLFTTLAGIQMNHVPYKGSGQARADLLGGQVLVSVSGIASVINDVKGGQLRALAVTSAKRSPLLLDVPTMAEAGVEGYAADQWLGFLAPAKMPREAIAKLNQVVQTVLAQASVQKRFQNIGAQTAYLGPEEFSALLRSELPKWGKVVQAVGLRVE